MGFKLLIVYYYFRTRVLEFALKCFGTRFLEFWQRYNLRNHLKWISKYSPFYRGYLISIDIQDPYSALSSLPLMNKELWMNNFNLINSAGLDKDQAFDIAISSERTRNFTPTLHGYTVGLSSGTSGHRGLFVVSTRERAQHAGTMLAKVLPFGLLARYRVAFFLRANSNLYTASRSSLLQFKFYDLINDISTHVDDLNSYQPTLVFAPPSVLSSLAKLQKSNQLKIKPLKIISVAETLDPLDEKIISSVFQQKVHQVYQCTEGFLGITCREGNLHLNEDGVYLEKEWIDPVHKKFIPIITDFNRCTQPLIRYRLNDVLTDDETPCPCGSPFNRLKQIEGRADDCVEFLSSENTPITILPDFIRRCVLLASTSIEDYSIIQTQPGELTIQLAIISSADQNQIESQIKNEIELLVKLRNAAMPKLKFEWQIDQSANGSMTKRRRVRRVKEQLQSFPQSHFN